MLTNTDNINCFKLLDFKISDCMPDDINKGLSLEDDVCSDNNKTPDTFIIQMFGINKLGHTCSIFIDDFKPFFYVKLDVVINDNIKNDFISFLIKKLGYGYNKCIYDSIVVERETLYGFDNHKKYNFIRIEFINTRSMKKCIDLWYNPYKDNSRTLKSNGLMFHNYQTFIYESNIPSVLRFFHINDISPSGWIGIDTSNGYITTVKQTEQNTTCKYEYICSYNDIIPMNHMDDIVPYKICSFDIEANSSHGDFPVPIKTYKKLATNIIEYLENTYITKDNNNNIDKSQLYKLYADPKKFNVLLYDIILNAFGFSSSIPFIDIVYPKQNIHTEIELTGLYNDWINKSFKLTTEIIYNETMSHSIEEFYLKQNDDGGLNDDGNVNYPTYNIKKNKKNIESNIESNISVFDIIQKNSIDRETTLFELAITLNQIFPKLKGDEVTFIGSTFMKYGSSEPYLSHCISKNNCSELTSDNTELESYDTEKEVLLAWTNLIQREDPDIIIGYNIFGFDYEFMFRRSKEMSCMEEFLQLSRNKNEPCYKTDWKTGAITLEEQTIVIASGQHNISFIPMSGRLQIDLYNVFRREENLISYKLDYVAGYFIGDYIKNINIINKNELLSNTTNRFECNLIKIKTNHLCGISVGNYIHFEKIDYSTEYYNNGNKFKVMCVDKDNNTFYVDCTNLELDITKKNRWCLAKDDVTPKDIFTMTNGSNDDRAVIAKYCIQDCNLVQYLMHKVDTLTGFIEMSRICSVPMSYLVFRGQGIKLTSYISKKCREKDTLMPVINKGDNTDGYEGAIVLKPKCDLYLDNPVACVDYASLYPSSMISENLSHDSKVWTKEYDLSKNIIKITGERNSKGKFIYDNLNEYKYVTITYDTFKYTRKTPSSAVVKVLSGYKECRFVQCENDSSSIMPSILKELLSARKYTRKQIPKQTDEFMKKVLNKRQLGYKVTANSLYGQCGARTSTFYEQDIAASTTATGRVLLIYAKEFIERAYGDTICNTTNHGKVRSKAEYIYGDTDSVFFTFNLESLEGVPIRGKKALEITIELAQECGKFATKSLKHPHDLEYEKTFMPFCLLSKKRYVGMLYELDHRVCYRNEMGIVLKRRDNAPIVKDIYGGIIDILMKEMDISKAIQFLTKCLGDIVNGNYPIDKLIITKSLRSGYKNPRQIAHKVLADRVTARDPGNKLGPGDRIPYVFIHTKNKKDLQGNKIEIPSYVIDNKIPLDYSFYISNQIMKPVLQVFALILFDIWRLDKKIPKINRFKQTLITLKNSDIYQNDEKKYEDKVEKLKNLEVKKLLFDKFLIKSDNIKYKNNIMTTYFKDVVNIENKPIIDNVIQTVSEINDVKYRVTKLSSYFKKSIK
jgi:DNA polymerase elongation subunit (family B)